MRTDGVSRHTRWAELPELLTVEEARVFLGLGRSTLYDLLRRGALPCVRYGRVIRVPKHALAPAAPENASA